MSNIEIKHLVNYNRFSDKYNKLLYTILYLPFGFILFILRTILALSILFTGYILPDTPAVHKVLNKIACLSLGISINIEDPSQIQNVKVYISNSASILDHLAVFSAIGAVSIIFMSTDPMKREVERELTFYRSSSSCLLDIIFMSTDPMKREVERELTFYRSSSSCLLDPGPDLKSAISKAVGLHYFGTPSNIISFKKSISTFINEKRHPVYFTPEGKVTNGKALLKFKTQAFGLCNEVQPIVINVQRPFLDISLSTLGSGYWTDIFFYMFSPYTIYSLVFLPVQKKDNFSDEEFAEVVRNVLAEKLGIPLTATSAADVLEWEKRKIAAEQQRARLVQEPPRNIQLKQQALRVKEVLPHVPLNVIYEDLCRTRNVDSTISNILEGHISFIPEPIPSTTSTSSDRQQSSSSSTPSSSRSSPSTSSSALSGTYIKDFNTAASVFGKSMNDRSKSFQERKEQLIANARRRYIEKHNLDISV